ncbi:MAG: hemerythrin domain-containing protein [Planctomycetota bacterium]
MIPIKTLEKEHRIIDKFLDALERLAGRIRLYRQVDITILMKSLEFMKHFTDRCHYQKEEDIIFPEMQERGLSPNYGPLGVLIHEHEAERAYARQIEEGLKRWQDGESEAINDIINGLVNYVTVGREHLQKENNILYPMVKKIFSGKGNKKLQSDFNQFEQRKMGGSLCCKYHNLADDIDKSILN